MSVCTHFDSYYDSTLLLPLEQICEGHRYLLEAIGEHYFMRSMYGKALGYYFKSCQYSDSPFYISEKIIECYGYLKKYKEAILYFENMPSHGEEISEELYSKIAIYCRDEEDYNKSIFYYEKALSINKSSWYLNSIGWCHQMLKNFDKALDYHLEVFQMDPTDNWNLKNLGFCYQMLKKPNEALTYYEKSNRIYANDPWLILNLGWIYFVLGELEKANQKFGMAIAQKAEFGKQSLMNYAHTSWCLGNVERAEEYYLKSLMDFADIDDFCIDMESDFEFVNRWGNITREQYQGMIDQTIEKYNSGKK